MSVHAETAARTLGAGSNLQLLGWNPTATRGVFQVLADRNRRVQFLLPAQVQLNRISPVLPGLVPMMTADTFTWHVENARYSGRAPEYVGDATAYFRTFDTSSEAGRRVTLGVGATLNVGQNQPGGVYEGNYTIYFAYR